MRSLPLLVMLLAAAPVPAAQAYRWVDKDGVVHFSDKPVAGAEKIPLTPAPKPGSVPQTFSAPSRRDEIETASVAYTSCAFASPAYDRTFQQTEPVSIVLDLQPGLQSGDRVMVRLNGNPIEGWPDAATSFQLPPQPRGAYTLVAQLTGPDGVVKCTAPTVSFNVFQPIVRLPGRKPAPR